MGYNDAMEARVVTPPLTTVRPLFYEMGQKAVEMVLTMIAGGKTPGRVVLIPKLIVRESCGCLSPVVVEAAARPRTVVGSAKANREKFKAALTTQQEEIVAEMTQAAEKLRESLNPAWAEQLLDGFASELAGDSAGAFLAALDKVLRQAVANGDMSALHGALSVLRRYTLPYLDDKALLLAEDLWQQARTAIGETSVRAQMYKSLQTEQRKRILSEIATTLTTKFDLNDLMDILSRELPRLGLSRGYLSLYEDPQPYQYPQPLPQWSRLVLAYDDEKPAVSSRVELEPGGRRFPSRQLVPPEILPKQKLHTLVILALYFKHEQIGFMLLDGDQRDGDVYDILRAQISSALQGALLVKRIQARSAEITRQKYILDTFMANVPDSIYFKDRESRIIRSNKAHATSLGLTAPGDLLGKSDFDFFPGKLAQLKYNQEQEIIRTGKPILEIEESNAEGSWALTTKMPLQDENGEIIGTFGISRDITELKQAQQELSAAYEEINIMNEQLKDENIQMHTEMDLARRIQTALLPPLAKDLHPHFEIAAVMLPAEEVGGDYYDIALDRKGDLWFGIGDVSGHGVTPGLIMMMAQTVHTAITTNYHVNARDIVCMINKVMLKNVQGRLHKDHYMTFTTLKYIGDGRFQHAGKHLDLIVYRQRTQTCERIKTIGTWLNFTDDIDHCTENSEFRLKLGDVLVLYTDGITEAWNSDEEILDTPRFMDIVKTHAEQEMEASRDAIIADVMSWCQGKQRDDMSLVIIRRIK